MKYLLILLAAPVLSISECGQHKKNNMEPEKEQTAIIDSSRIPECIQVKIDSIGKEARWNPPAQVDQYTYNNQTVYFFTSDCCDQFNLAYNSSCHVICAPSGGFSGKGDGRCSEFLKTAQHVKLVWKDPR